MKNAISALAATLLLAPALLACERDEGPVEKVGRKVDEAIEKVTHPGEGPLEKAGRETDEAIEAVKRKLE
jgi:hypothetical protein